jgi:hypothetical protein
MPSQLFKILTGYMAKKEKIKLKICSMFVLESGLF